MTGAARAHHAGGRYPGWTKVAPPALAAIVVGAVAAAAGQGVDPFLPFAAAVAALAGLSVLWIAAYVRPAVLLSIALLLAPFSGSWEQLGIPGALAPDRLVLAGAIVAVAVRTPGARDRSRFRAEPVHYLLGIAAVWAVASAILSGTIFEREAFFGLLESYGILPYAAFAVAPLVFRTERERAVLLRALVLLGAYLGLTALFETIGLRALVFPRYISDPTYGIQNSSWGRARGPFTEAVTNGVALYACAVAAVVACVTWRGRAARASAAAVAVLCGLGALFTLQRAIWIGTALASVFTLLALRRLRRYVLPTFAAGIALVIGSLALVPGLEAKVVGRGTDRQPIYDRLNLNEAAFGAVGAHPLTGLGWHRFLDRNVDFFQQAADRPLIQTATVTQVLKVDIAREPVHNVFLGYAAELGLVGLSLWLLALAFGVGGALRTRPPPPLAYWRAGLVALTIAVLFASATVPPANFPMLILWLWAGVVWAGRAPEAGTR
ncbi:MAG TPA: O-antigen ligase family protein [Gaiellaceae bacterium]|nr:O-antigen ligase family protein [Gaiellaceae bacterium]